MCGSLADKDTSAYSNTRMTRIYEVCVFTRIHVSQMVYRVCICVCVSGIKLPRISLLILLQRVSGMAVWGLLKYIFVYKTVLSTRIHASMFSSTAMYLSCHVYNNKTCGYYQYNNKSCRYYQCNHKHVDIIYHIYNKDW